MNPKKTLSVKDRQKLKSKVWRNPLYFLAFGFGAGLMKRAPGTWGTCMGIPIYLLMEQASSLVYLSLLGCFFIFGVGLCQRVSMEIGIDDYPGIVWDEIVGFLVTMFSVPTNMMWVILGFGLFRLFDIIKPQPIRWVDKHCRGGWAIMLDDVLAGIAACLVLHIISWGIKG